MSGLILDESEVFLDVVLKYSVAGFIAKINRESSAVTYPLLYFIFFKKQIGLANLKTQVRAKVRASDVRLVFVWSTAVLRSVS